MRDLILIVDDNPDIRAFVRLSLESEDFRVIESVDGDDAMKRFEETKVNAHPSIRMMEGFKATCLVGFRWLCGVALPCVHLVQI